MQPERYLPCSRLKPFIQSFLFIECEQERENYVLPDTAVVLSVRYRGQVGLMGNDSISSLPVATFSGIRSASQRICYGRQSANLLVIFRPGGAAAFFQEPLHELSGHNLDISYLKHYSDFTHVAEQLSVLPSNTERVACIERVLLSRLVATMPDALVLAAVAKIGMAHGSGTVKALSRELYISQDAFEKRFRKAVGTSAKHFSSIIRLRHAIGLHIPDKSLTHLALEAGYYDQAHFIKEFRTFTGKPPRRFFQEGAFW